MLGWAAAVSAMGSGYAWWKHRRTLRALQKISASTPHQWSDADIRAHIAEAGLHGRSDVQYDDRQDSDSTCRIYTNGHFTFFFPHPPVARDTVRHEIGHALAYIDRGEVLANFRIQEERDAWRAAGLEDSQSAKLGVGTYIWNRVLNGALMVTMGIGGALLWKNSK